MTPRIFLLSPASCTGKRGRMLLREEARFELAVRLRDGAPIGEVFVFLSGLYFRGKLAYAMRFGQPPERVPGALIITPDVGLLPVEARVTARDLRRFTRVDIDAAEPRYRRPLLRDTARLAESAGADTEIVLLGSVATGKYVDVLREVLGRRLLFPADFAGRGDMSRGGLLLRCSREGRELRYVSVEGGRRRGPRPPRLSRARRSAVAATGL